MGRHPKYDIAPWTYRFHYESVGRNFRDSIADCARKRGFKAKVHKVAEWFEVTFS